MIMLTLNVIADQNDVTYCNDGSWVVKTDCDITYYSDGTWVKTEGDIIFKYKYNKDEVIEINKLLEENPNISTGEIMKKISPGTLEKALEKSSSLKAFLDAPFNDNTLQQEQIESVGLTSTDGCYSYIYINGNTIQYESATYADYVAEALWIRSSLKRHPDWTAIDYVQVADTDFIAYGSSYDLPPTGNYITEGAHSYYEDGKYGPWFSSLSDVVSFYNPYE